MARVTTDFDGIASGTSVAVQADGKILVTGAASTLVLGASSPWHAIIATGRWTRPSILTAKSPPLWKPIWFKASRYRPTARYWCWVTIGLARTTTPWCAKISTAVWIVASVATVRSWRFMEVATAEVSPCRRMARYWWKWRFPGGLSLLLAHRPFTVLFLQIILMAKDKLTPKNKATASDAFRVTKCGCPQYCSISRSCMLVKEGLFLPMDQHVASYCLSSHYPSCSHYQLQAAAEGEINQKYSELLNRRQSIRIPSSHTFLFSEITAHDQIPGVRENDAWTVDLSDHGIRFASRQLLTADTAIRFILKADINTPEIEGTGRVIWCEPLVNTPLYHAAIAFTERPDVVLLPHHRNPH